MMDDMECMKEDMVTRLHELTDVDFERDSANFKRVWSALAALEVLLLSVLATMGTETMFEG